MIEKEMITHMGASLNKSLSRKNADTCLLLTGLDITDKFYAVEASGYTNAETSAKMIAGYLKNNPDVNKLVRKLTRPELLGGLSRA